MLLSTKVHSYHPYVNFQSVKSQLIQVAKTIPFIKLSVFHVD